VQSLAEAFWDDCFSLESGGFGPAFTCCLLRESHTSLLKPFEFLRQRFRYCPVLGLATVGS
jgi:hypothetical protein